MKALTKTFIVAILCLMAFSVNAQRCAVLEFKAGSGISQADVDGISAIFITYFRPAGYTMVERTQIDKVIEEQGFQRSRMTQAQMVRVGEILNVSKIVVGDINYVFGQYQVDARVINVETGTIAATEGATFATSSYRSSMQSVAQKLAGKIAISSGGTVPASPTATATPRKRTSVEVLYGYLKIFPNELGTFQAEPTSVISQINAQAQHGYNNWRIPTNEELSLLRANNYLGNGEYMTREKRNGIVLLVTDGKDYATLQAEEQERIRAEQERIALEREKQEKAEQDRIKAAKERKAKLQEQGLVDLGLPSGTLWKSSDENGKYTQGEAEKLFGERLPSKKQFEELVKECSWIWSNGYYKVVGPNGEYIILYAGGAYLRDDCWARNNNFKGGGDLGYYWSIDRYGWVRTSCGGHAAAYLLYFSKNTYSITNRYIDEECSVRLIQNSR